MATEWTYYYLLGRSDKIDFIKTSPHLQEYFFTFEDGSKARFIISKDDEAIPIKYEGGDAAKSAFKDYVIVNNRDFIRYISTLNSNFVIGGISDKKIIDLQCIYTKENVNWSKTIDDLVEKGLVHTKPTKSMLASDQRKFWFSTEKEETAIDVDCLGMSLHREITDRVKVLWSSL